MRNFNVPNIIPVGTVMNATINSAAQNLVDTYAYAIQIVFTGTPTGSFKLQGSNDGGNLSAASGGKAANSAPVNWTDIPNTSQSVSAAGSYMWNESEIGYNWVRLVYTDTSGGTSTAIVTVATFNSKVI